MRIPAIFILGLAVVHANHGYDLNNDFVLQSSPLASRNNRPRQLPTPASKRAPPSSETETLIENKNVNIVVNVDPKDVAEELWKIIESRNPALRRTPASKRVIRELENVVTPVIVPTRRSKPSPLELANALDRITRRSFVDTAGERTALEEEILTREIVAQMMAALNNFKNFEERSRLRYDSLSFDGRRMLQAPKISTGDSGDDGDTVKLLITVKKNKLREALL